MNHLNVLFCRGFCFLFLQGDGIYIIIHQEVAVGTSYRKREKGQKKGKRRTERQKRTETDIEKVGE